MHARNNLRSYKTDYNISNILYGLKSITNPCLILQLINTPVNTNYALLRKNYITSAK